MLISSGYFNLLAGSDGFWPNPSAIRTSARSVDRFVDDAEGCSFLCCLWLRMEPALIPKHLHMHTLPSELII